MVNKTKLNGTDGYGRGIYEVSILELFCTFI